MTALARDLVFRLTPYYWELGANGALVPKDFYLYAARQVATTGPIKLGRALNPQRRISQFLAPGPLELLQTVPEWAVSERVAHRQWAHLRRHGEWFEATPELLAWIEAIGRIPAKLARHRDLVLSILEHRRHRPLRALLRTEKRLHRALLYERRAARIRASL